MTRHAQHWTSYKPVPRIKGTVNNVTYPQHRYGMV